MVRRYGLREDQWEKIEGLLPGRDETVGVTAKDNGCLSKRCCIGIARGFRAHQHSAGAKGGTGRRNVSGDQKAD